MNIIDKNWTIQLTPFSTDLPSSKVLFLGDVALARGVAEKIDNLGYQYSFANVDKVFKGKDAIVFNLECCLTDRGEAWEPKPVIMNGKSEYLNIFPKGPNYYANVSNNHFLDLGEIGAKDTVNAVLKKGMQCFGVIDQGLENFESIIHLPKNKISLLAYSPVAHPLPFKSDINVSYKSINEMNSDVKKSKLSTDLLVVSLHQGVEFCRYTDKDSRNRAHALIDAGADCIICHHTHAIQGVEIYKGKPIFYGIGNFLIDIDTKKMPKTKYSLGIELVVQDRKIKAVEVFPFFINDQLQVENLCGDENEKLRLEINWLSSFFVNDLLSTVNYLLSRLMWFKLHMKSVLNMYKRTGFKAMSSYYISRVSVKLFNK